MASTISKTTITDLASLERAIDEAYDIFDELPFWRGHGHADWDLQPHVFRPVKTAENVKAFENSLLYHFRMRGTARTTHSPNFDDEFGWLLLAQHYGLPTRILDWTSSPLTALFFAANEPVNDGVDGCIWALHASSLNLQQMGRRHLANPYSEPVSSVVSDAYKGETSGPKAYAFAARELDSRMMVQGSRFTIHGDATELSKLNISPKTLYKFVVPSRAKPGIRSLLTALDVTVATLFPDLAGLAVELRSTWFTS